MIIFGSPTRNRIQNLVIGVTGKTTGTATAGTLVFSATEDISAKISVTGSATFSVAVAADDIYKKHTITLNCANNQSGTLVIGDKNKIVSLGNHGGSSTPNTNLYAGTDATCPTIALNLNDLPSGLQKIRQAIALNSFTTTGNKALPTGLTYLVLTGNNINWTYSGALPTGLTYLILTGNNINWTYSGALPTGITLLYLYGTNINWTYSGALPTGITYLVLTGNNINWTYSGALPTGITSLVLVGNNINWTYSGALPTGLTYLYLIGTIINWTYGLITGNATFTEFNLTNHRTTPYSDAEVIALMDSLRTKTGGLPATIRIGDYLNYASPPQSVLDAKTALIAAGKGVSTINLTV